MKNSVPKSENRLSKLIHDKLIADQTMKKFPTFYKPRRFIAVFTRPSHWTLTLSHFKPIHIRTNNFFKIHINIISPYTTSELFYWVRQQAPLNVGQFLRDTRRNISEGFHLLLFRFATKFRVYFLSCLPYFGDNNNVWCGVQIINVLSHFVTSMRNNR
jgi:hypothetical protein